MWMSFSWHLTNSTCTNESCLRPAPQSTKNPSEHLKEKKENLHATLERLCQGRCLYFPALLCGTCRTEKNGACWGASSERLCVYGRMWETPRGGTKVMMVNHEQNEGNYLIFLLQCARSHKNSTNLLKVIGISSTDWCRKMFPCDETLQCHIYNIIWTWEISLLSACKMS